MAYITAELSLDEMDDWFKIGHTAGQQQKPEAVVASTLRGHIFDPDTGGTYRPDLKERLDSKLPKYRRSTHKPSRQQYVDEYRQQEQDELLSLAAPTRTNDQLSPDSVAGQLDCLELDSTVIGGSVAIPEDLVPEGALGVYSNFDFQHKYMQLPVLEERETIVNTIESNQVTVIQGPTGSGKTTQVPQFILDHYAEESRYCNIIVTQPRKIAAMSIARRVCDERGWAHGTVCGFQIGYDRDSSEDTRILYCTTGVLKEKFIRRKNMHEYTHVILDEVHERDIESDFALLVVKKLLRTNSQHVKVILMSATFDTAAFAQFFALPVRNHLEPAPVVTVGTMLYHVSEFFADDLTSRLGEVPPLDDARPGIDPAMYDMAIGLIKEFDLLEEKEQGKDSRTGFAPVRGWVLIFLPGIHEITSLLGRLHEIEQTHLLTPIPLHSSITLDEQNKVFLKPTRGYRKVIISTNIAESSITVPDIKYVIDFCLTKNLFCDPETNFTQLQLEWASKANTKQRKGRAGRVSNGRVYFMVPRWFYEMKLPEYGVPEMQRSPLESLILKTKVFDMGKPKALLALALSPPNLEDIERTILSLKEVGALSSSVGEFSDPYDGDLTFIGHVLAGLPVDIRIGKLLVLGHVFGVLEECIIIGAAMSVKSIFAQPMRARLDAFKNKMSWSDHSLSDCIAILNAYRVWQNRVKLKEFERAGAKESQWGVKHYIQVKTIREVSKVVDELEQRLTRFNIVKPTQRPRYKASHTDPTEKLILKMVLCGAFYPNYALKEESDEMEAVKILSNNDPLRTVVVKGLPLNQGILYHKQIQDIFSSCYKDPPPVISSEESRAFVEFCWRQGSISEGQVHPGVLCALKIRQLGITMSFDMYDKEETGRKLQELSEISQSARNIGDLRSNRFRADTSKVEFQEGNNLVKIDPQISTLIVSVTEVIQCGHFWAQCDDIQSANLPEKIYVALNGPGVQLQKPMAQAIKTGMLVAAPYQDVNVMYYRARVESMEMDRVATSGGTIKTVKKIKVFFIDFGNSELVPEELLRALPPALHSLPFLAVEFFLKGLQPSSVECPDGVWSKQANAMFRKMALNKNLYAQVYSVVNNTVRVELVEKYPNGLELSLNNELVRLQFADTMEEPFLSQQNHEWRESQKRGETNMTQPDSRLQVHLSVHSGGLRNEMGKRRGKKIFLSGPISPLEMRFNSMTFSGRQRAVKVEPDSVNCVTVDENPQNRFSRLMVAGFIGLNAAGNTMIARDTTIMPQIPGLPALVTLLFAPYAEYRADPKYERYIGALCGLGFDENDQAILPDHDIELTFETTFDNDDIAMINQVRMAINMAVGTNDTMAHWGVDVFARFQEKARNHLLKLLKKKREAVEPQYFRKLYEWNQVDPKYVLYHSLDDTDADSHSLLRLHNAIALEETQQIPEATHMKEYFIKHLEDLERKVACHDRQQVTCELCSVTLATSQVLAIHMQTESHLRRVTKLKDGLMK